MAHLVAHTFVNPQPDDGDPNVSGPDEWNANHVVTIDDTLINHNNLANLTLGDPHTQYFLESNAAALTRVDDTNVTLTLSAGAPTALLNATSITVGWTGQLAASRGGTGVSSLGTLSRTNDTNVTITLGGTPAGSLIQDVSLTLGWTGQLSVSRGGTGVSALGDISRVNDTNVTLTLGGTPLGAVVTSTSFTLGWTGQLATGRGGTGVSSLGNITRVDDTNVTLTLGGTPTGAVITSTSFTLGWTGTLAAARLNANVVQAITNDTNVTGSISAQNLTLSWTGTLAVARGGIGVGTLASNGVLYGNGTGAVQALAVNATATNKFLTQSSSSAPSWATIVAGDLPGSFSGFANPTASVGLAAVNGSATTAMRSDGAPALSQAIVPTWTGAHTFSGNVVTLSTGNVRTRLSASDTYVPTSQSDDSTMAVFYRTVAPTAANDLGTGHYGLSSTVEHLAGAFNIAGMRGLSFGVTQGVAATTLTAGEGVVGFVNASAGTITTATGVLASLISGSGTLTTGIGFDVATQNLFGTFTTAIGLRIQAPSGVIGTHIAIQSLGGENRFVGNVKIGANSTPAVPLDVVGAIKGSTTINAITGFQINGAAASGNLMVGNGTNFVALTTSWTTYSFTNTDFTAAAGSWTVVSGSVLNCSYYIIGKFMVLSYNFFNTTVTNACLTLRFLIPGGKTSARQTDAIATAIDNGGNWEIGQARAESGDTHIYFFRANAANWSVTVGGASIRGQIMFEIQ